MQEIKSNKINNRQLVLRFHFLSINTLPVLPGACSFFWGATDREELLLDY